jgi:hypothetical protein
VSLETRDTMNPEGGGPRVLYVVGHPRSGSTILGNVLAEIPGVFHAGELHYLWKPGLPEPRQVCGCGAPVRACPLWRRIFSVAFDAPKGDAPAAAGAEAPTAWGLPGVDVARVYELQRRALAALPTARTLVNGRRHASGAAAEYLDVMGRIYRAITTVTGSSVIVDSSKWAHDANLVGRLGGLEVAFLHLVREPFGSVYSRLPRDRADVPGSARPASGARVLLESLRWVKSNLLAEVVVRRTGRPSMTVRYEDFVADCGETILRIADLVGLDVQEAPVRGGQIELGTNHTVGGNRNRWQKGALLIRPDQRWRSGLRHRDVAIVSLATWPYRLRHHYAS